MCGIVLWSMAYVSKTRNPNFFKFCNNNNNNNFYRILFYNTVDILHPKEILLHHSSWFSASSPVRSLLVILLLNPSTHYFLGFLFLLMPSIFHSSNIFLEFCYFNSTSNVQTISIPYFYYLNNVVLDIQTFSNFQVPSFPHSEFS